MISREVRVLMRKEWRQLLRSRSAVLTAVFFPLLFLLIIPGFQMVAFSAMGGQAINDLPQGVPLPSNVAAISDDPRALLRVLMLPLFVMLTGLVVPSISAIYTLISERENRTIELLVALPVRVSQILLAKLLVIVLLAGTISLTLFVIDAVLILALGIATIGYVLALLLLLICTLAYSTAGALLISLLARDFRTANNISGILIGPVILISMPILLFVPGTILAVLSLTSLYALAALAITLISLRVVTFERLLR